MNVHVPIFFTRLTLPWWSYHYRIVAPASDLLSQSLEMLADSRRLDWRTDQIASPLQKGW
jgi:hypothetical protein